MDDLGSKWNNGATVAAPRPTNVHETREGWLTAARDLCIERIFADELKSPTTVACGWPGGKSPLKTIGQCFPPEWAANGTTHIWISPALHDPVNVLETLVHELIHAIIGCDKKHGRHFRKAMEEVGLEGKPTATVAGEDLREQLLEIADELGPYPHDRIAWRTKAKSERKSTRVKLVSPVDPDYVVHIVPARLEEYGAPLCPMCNQPMVEDPGS